MNFSSLSKFFRIFALFAIPILLFYVFFQPLSPQVHHHGSGHSKKSAVVRAPLTPKEKAQVVSRGSYQCTLPPGRKLAIAQKRWYHTEVFGFIFEYALACSHSVIVYHTQGHVTSALDLYLALFPFLEVEVRNIEFIDKEHEEYDAIFFTTPDDDINADFRYGIQHKSVYLAHLTHPKFIQRWHTLRLHMSPLAGYPFIIPAYRGDVPMIPAEGRAREIIMVGTVHDGSNYNIRNVLDFFKGASEKGWKAKIFTRYWGSQEKIPDYIEVVYDSPTDAMFKAVQRASYILIFPNDNSWYLSDRVTGALPLAISAVTPIVTTTDFAELYEYSPELHGVVSGSDIESMVQALDMSPASYVSLVSSLSSYRSRLMRNNFAVIEMTLSGVPEIAASVSQEKEENGPTSEAAAHSEAGNFLPLSKFYSKRRRPETGF
jgi:hypothetical protein